MRPQSDRIIVLALGLLLAVGGALWLLLSEGSAPLSSRLPSWMAASGGYLSVEADPGFVADTSSLVADGREFSPVELLVDDQGLTLVGTAFRRPGEEQMAALRWRRDGSPDRGFGSAGLASVDFAGGDQVARGGLRDLQGNWLLHGHGADGAVRRNMVLARLDRSGGLDASFDGDGRLALRFGDGIQSAEAALVDDAARIVVAGYAEQDIVGERFREMALARLLPDGSLDPAFGDGGLRRERVALATHDQTVHDLLPLAGGGLLGVGSSAAALGEAARASLLLQWLPAGLPDAGFGRRGQAESQAGTEFLAVAAAADGAFWVAGRRESPAQATVQRMLADGRPDLSFGDHGRLLSGETGSDRVTQAWLLSADQEVLWVIRRGGRLDCLVLPTQAGLPSLSGWRTILLRDESDVAPAWDQGWLYLASATAADGVDLTLARYAVPAR